MRGLARLIVVCLFGYVLAALTGGHENLRWALTYAFILDLMLDVHEVKIK